MTSLVQLQYLLCEVAFLLNSFIFSSSSLSLVSSSPKNHSVNMGFNLHASGTEDPPEVRNWRIHLMAIIMSMGSVAMGYDTSVIGGTSKAYSTSFPVFILDDMVLIIF